MISLLIIAILCILVVIFIFFIIKDLIQIDNKITELNNKVVSKR